MQLNQSPFFVCPSTRKVRTFWCDSTPYEWECEFGSSPNEAKITRKLDAGYPDASSMAVHSSDGNLPTAKDGKRHLSPSISVRWMSGKVNKNQADCRDINGQHVLCRPCRSSSSLKMAFQPEERSA